MLRQVLVRSTASVNPSNVLFLFFCDMKEKWWHAHLFAAHFQKYNFWLSSSSEAPYCGCLSDARFHYCLPWKASVENFQRERLHIVRVREESKKWRGGNLESSLTIISKWVWIIQNMVFLSPCLHVITEGGKHWDNKIEPSSINFMVCLMEGWQVVLLLCTVSVSDVA